MNQIDKISNIIQKNFISKISFFSKYLITTKVLETKHFARIDASIPSNTFNIAVIKKQNTENIKSILAQTADYFNNKLFPAALWFWEMPNYEIEEEMKNRKFVITEQELGMYLPIDKINTDDIQIENFLIKEVSSRIEMNDFSEILSSIFGNSKESFYVKEYYKLITQNDLYKNSSIKYYIGYYNENAVSTGCLYFTEESIGIYDISTSLHFRKQGFGTAMFNYLLSKIKNDKREYCILQASEDGVKMYKNFGFKEVIKINIYENNIL